LTRKVLVVPRVSVWPSGAARALLGAGDAAGAAAVLHHHRLAEAVAQLVGDDARDGVAARARGEGHDQADLLAREGVLLSMGEARRRQHGGGREGSGGGAEQ
jgi:hypothetical protein